MSQSGTYIQGAGPGPFLEALTGNTGGRVGPDGTGNINIPGSHGINTAGNPGTNTVTVALNNTITLGDLSSVGPFADSLTLSSGDITINGGNTNLKKTSVGGTSGVIYVGNNTFLNTYSNSSVFTTFMGLGSGNVASTLTGFSNVCLGSACLASLQNASANTVVGDVSFRTLVTGTGNVSIGFINGANYSSGESFNILLGYSIAGVAGENNKLRIGNGTGSGTGQINASYISGIYGITPGSSTTANVIIDNNGQLGTGSSNPILSITNVNTTPYVVLATDQFLLVDTSTMPIVIQLPNSTTTGRIITIKDASGNAMNENIDITTVGGSVLIDGATTTIINTTYSASTYIFDGTNYYGF
jgi:hypothetical protein